ADAIASAAVAAADAEEAEAGADAALDAAAAHRETLGPREPLEQVARDHAERDRLRALVERGEAVLHDARSTRASASHRLDTARAGAILARAAREAARTAHAAHALVGSLRVGAPCPVCRQTVASVPEIDGPDLA